MTISDFLQQLGCRCFDGSIGTPITLPDGTRVRLHPGIDCHTTTSLVRGADARPRTSKYRRPWLRARRNAVRATGRPPQNESITYVHCRGCEITGSTTEQLEGAF